MQRCSATGTAHAKVLPGRGASAIRRGAACTLMLFAVQVLHPSSVRAADPGGATATAESQALFDEAMKLVEAGKYSDACPKLEASLKLDPAIGTRYYLADCYEHTGRLASAFALFRDVAETAEKKNQKDAAAKRAKALEARLVRLVIDVPKNVESLPGLVVERGGVALLPGQFGATAPVDPGPILIAASAPGRKRWEMTLDATKEGATLTVQVPLLERETSAAAPAAVTSAAPAAGTSAAPVSSAQRIGGIVMAGLGLASLGIGGALGAVALDKKSASEQNDHCDAAAVCDDIGLALRHDGRAAGAASTALFIAGGALLGGGVILFLTSPAGVGVPQNKSTLSAFLGAGSLGVRGRW